MHAPALRLHPHHHRPVSPLSVLIAAVAALAAFFAIGGITGIFGSPASASTLSPALPGLKSAAGGAAGDDLANLPVKRAASARPVFTAARTASAAMALYYTVRPGDSISSVAAARCGSPADWTGIYAASRKLHLTAWNANDLAAGQHLAIQCYQAPSMAGRSPLPKPPPVSMPATPAGSTTLTSVNVSTPEQSPRSAASTAYQGQGIYSVSQLENLWESAGGPAWAAAHAAEIAQCESGGNASAYNPSGATGIWQILGSVIPGNLDNPAVNAANAVAKFNASGQTFAQWVCQ